MNALTSTISKFKIAANRVTIALFATFGVVLSFVILSLFATLGLALLGFSAVFLCIPLALGSLTSAFQSKAAPTQ